MTSAAPPLPSKAGRRASWPLRVGAGLVVLLVATVLLYPILASSTPFDSDFAHGATALGDPAGPNAAHLLGTDRLFRDVAVRLAVATRTSVIVAALSSFLAVTLGGFVGIIAGYYKGAAVARMSPAVLLSAGGAAVLYHRGASGLVALLAALLLYVALIALARRVVTMAWLAGGPALDADTLLMRLVDAGLSLPLMVVMMGVAAGVQQMSAPVIVAMLGGTGWFTVARIVRAKVLVLRQETFIEAARGLGGGDLEIIARHIVPNLTPLLAVQITLLAPQMVMAECTLGFLGAGLPLPTPSLGQLIYDGKDAAEAYPWMVLAPAMALTLTVLALHLVGRGLTESPSHAR